MMIKCLLTILLVGVWITGANARTSHQVHHAPHNATPVTDKFVQTGIASWYGGKHNGRLMADGGRFNSNRFTCAHRLLPLGSIIRVSNPENGTSVQVQVTDRGPYVWPRVVDLSERAARSLGFKTGGLTKVKIEVVQLGHT